jgi:hypothetical protein
MVAALLVFSLSEQTHVYAKRLHPSSLTKAPPSGQIALGEELELHVVFHPLAQLLRCQNRNLIGETRSLNGGSIHTEIRVAQQFLIKIRREWRNLYALILDAVNKSQEMTTWPVRGYLSHLAPRGHMFVIHS